MRRTLQECVAIYDRMGLGLNEAFSYLNPYIQNCLNDYGLENKYLYICGFSQGAMVAIYTSLMQEDTIGGCISFSGIITPHTFLNKHAKTHPDTLLIHGSSDNLVRFEAQKFTKEQLENIIKIKKGKKVFHKANL